MFRKGQIANDIIIITIIIIYFIYFYFVCCYFITKKQIYYAHETAIFKWFKESTPFHIQPVYMIQAPFWRKIINTMLNVLLSKNVLVFAHIVVINVFYFSKIPTL